MTTALQIVTSALKKSGVIGVGQTASAEDANDAFDDLNDMLAQWQRKRWLVYHLVDVGVTSTGVQSYTVGPGGDISVAARPDRIEAAFIRYFGGTSGIGSFIIGVTPIGGGPPQVAWDRPLQIIEAREDYNRIAIKSLASWPMAVFYDSAYPLGVVYPWPAPTAGSFELHLSLKEQLGAFANLNATVNLPPEYTAALKWNLTARVCVSYAQPIPPGIVAFARDSLAVIRNANAQIPEMQMPAGLAGTRGRYNVYTDQSGNRN
jgi:hypothetical protein